MVEAMPDGLRKLPVVLFPDGNAMVQPTPLEVAERLGMQTHAQVGTV